MRDSRPRWCLGSHGFNDYSNFFNAAATYLAARGIASYSYDQRGFGRAAHRGMWPGTKTLARDLGSAVGALRRRHPGVPLYVLGMSMGGAVALVAMAAPDPPEVDGLILVAPAVWARETMPWVSDRGVVDIRPTRSLGRPPPAGAWVLSPRTTLRCFARSGATPW